MNRSNEVLKPRNGHTLVVGIVARISGCQNQKELSLGDQEDHAKEVVAELYQGPVEFRVIATKGKGERLDRPELVDIEEAYRSRELDLNVMEDVGRMVRGAEAARLWGAGVDNGTRSIAPNDCCDTAEDNWEEDLLAACRDHVGHQTHTSKRIKQKKMNRFKKFGGATPCEIYGYIKPPETKTFDDWQKDDAATPIIQEGARRLKNTLNCSGVADWFNQQGVSVGKYCRRNKWYGAMVRRYYSNTLLKGMPCRGKRHTIKHHEKGRRVSVPNPKGPVFREYPHLAHLDPIDFDELNVLLKAKNDKYHRKLVNGIDPRWQVSRKRTRFPGQHACCWCCGWHYVWGGNGVTENLMCSASREWHCWNSIGFNGELAVQRLVTAMTSAMYQLDGFDDQFGEIVAIARQNCSGGQAERWEKLLRGEESLAREKVNFQNAISKYGPVDFLDEKIKNLKDCEQELARERYKLEQLKHKELCLPPSILHLRGMLEEEFQRLAIDSPEFGNLMRQLVPEFHVYNVRLLDGGHLLPRARVKLALGGNVPDIEHVPGLSDLLTKVVTLDLFERPPQRERIRENAVRLALQGMKQRQIAAQLEERPRLPAVQRALALDQLMRDREQTSPYTLVTEPPDDYAKLRRHKSPKYQFQPREGYERPAI
ncbi:MAG: hypothetical protein WCJ35_10665 [Planctomycetota bacterium]